MPINTRELLDCLTTLMDEENLKVTIRETGKGTLVCATACFVGGVLGGPIGLAVGGTLGGLSAHQITKGLLAGPIGLAVGGTVGGIGAAILAKDTFKSVSQVVMNDLTLEQREALSQKIMFALSTFHPVDVAALLALLANNRAVHETVLNTVTDYITQEMRLKIVD